MSRLQTVEFQIDDCKTKIEDNTKVLDGKKNEMRIRN